MYREATWAKSASSIAKTVTEAELQTLPALLDMIVLLIMKMMGS